jgi:hypothetical protein
MERGNRSMRGAKQGDTGVPRVVAVYYNLRRNNKVSHQTAEELIRGMQCEVWTMADISVGITKGREICRRMDMKDG